MSNTTTKLIQAAALAAVLVPLGSVAVETATINCISNGSGCSGSYTSGGAQSNTWKFFSADEPGAILFYTLEISGTPTADFSLNVDDFITTQAALATSGALALFPNLTCIPTYDGVQCGLFDVSNFDQTNPDDMWDPAGFLMTITWRTTTAASQPPTTADNTILRAPDFSVFTSRLDDIVYDPNPTPTDPAISGRGDEFSRYGAFTDAASVPEPASLILLGTGVASLMYRARRRKRRY